MDYGGYTIWCGSHDCEQVERNAFLKIMYLVVKPRSEKLQDREAAELKRLIA